MAIAASDGTQADTAVTPLAVPAGVNPLARDASQGLLHPLTRTWSIRQNANQKCLRQSADQDTSSVAAVEHRALHAVGQYFSGLRTAIGCGSLDNLVAMLSFFKLNRIRTRIWQCILINGVIFMGSLLWLHSVVIPLLQLLLVFSGTDEIVSTAPFEALYSVLWVYPMYIVTLVLVSPRLFNDIARSAFEYSRDPQRQTAHLPSTRLQAGGRAAAEHDPPASPLGAPSSASPSFGVGRGGGGSDDSSRGRAVSTKVGSRIESLDLWTALDGAVRFGSDTYYYCALVGMFYLQTFSLVRGGALYLPTLLMPIIGRSGILPDFVGWAAKTVLFFMYSWLYSLYCFEYGWTLAGWGLRRQVRTLERHAAWFAGFGTPAAAVSMLFTPCVGLGFYSTLFPLLLLAAETAASGALLHCCVCRPTIDQSVSGTKMSGFHACHVHSRVQNLRLIWTPRPKAHAFASCGRLRKGGPSSYR